MAAKLGAAIAYPALAKLRKRMDPGSFNGAVFLGLNWQSYFAAPHLTFAALFLLSIALFQPGRFRRFLGAPRLPLKAGAAALIAAAAWWVGWQLF